MKKYNHAYDIGFSLISSTEDASDVTPEMFRTALVNRIEQLDKDNEWAEVVHAPFDTYEED